MALFKTFALAAILFIPFHSWGSLVNGTSFSTECIEVLKKKVLTLPNYQSKTIQFTNAYGEKHTNKKNSVQMVFDHQYKSGTDCFAGSVTFFIKPTPDNKSCTIEKFEDISDGDCRTEP